MAKTNKITAAKISCSPEQNISSNETQDSSVIYHPDDTVSFSDDGRAFWQQRLAKVGIDINTIKTRDGWGLALELSIKADTDTKSGMVELAAILTLDPVERAALKKKAAAVRVKERRAALRTVARDTK